MSEDRDNTAKSKRQERLEAALRENLKRRKEQARARRRPAAEPAEGGAESAAAEADAPAAEAGDQLGHFVEDKNARR
ncbi:hypothetical protein [Jiella sp. M17.18]|uniref:hypothetical protein n=1 Tax=Jiella sp. M17.18 TaxID=3234247 RepID=UPI0034DEECB5